MKKLISFIFFVLCVLVIYNFLMKPVIEFADRNEIRDEQIASDIFNCNDLLDTKTKIQQANLVVKNSIYDIDNNLKITSVGSAAIIKKTDNIYQAITNYHVIDKQNYYSNVVNIITFYGDEVNATVIKFDVSLDLALLEFDLTGLNAVVPVLIRSSALNQNEFLLACGNPKELNNLVTFGNYISSLEQINSYDHPVIYHNVYITFGSSGGGLYDVYGNLVGINTFTTFNNNQYSIPSLSVNNFLLGV